LKKVFWKLGLLRYPFGSEVYIKA